MVKKKSLENNAFRDFDEFETLFYNELDKRSVMLKGGMPSSLFGLGGTKNRYVRKVVMLKTAEDLDWYNENYNKLISLMKIWQGDKWKNPLDRHPVLHLGVTQVNITRNEAYSSVKILNSDDERLKIVRTGRKGGVLGRAYTEQDIKSLYFDLANFHPELEQHQEDDGTEYLLLTISCKQIHAEFAKQENVEIGSFTVQARRRSGWQYTARIRIGESDLIRKKFGFVVLDAGRPAKCVFLAPPQSERKHKAVKTRNTMTISGLKDITFFMKAN
ncbi:TPA: hypothetical protein ACX6Q1_003801 [Photobacterium damselae]